MAKLDQTDKPQWLQKVLVVSLGLNLFLAGFLVAKEFPTSDVSGSEPLTVSLSGLPQDISPQLREALETSFRKHSREVSKIYFDLNDARIKAREVLQQQELNEKALEDALANVRELQIKIQGPIHEALIEAAKELDVENRRQLVLFGDTFDRGIWQPRSIDGTRWRVEFDNGEFTLDLKGITDKDKADTEGQ